MKKLLALLTALTLLCACTPVLAVEMADVTGMWYLVGMTKDGVEHLPDELGVDVSIDLKEDGTARLISAGEEQTGKWSVAGESVGIVDASGSMMMLKVTAMNLVMTMSDGALMTFGRESVRLPRPQPIAADTVADFYGMWVSSFIYTDVKLTYTDEMGLEMRLRIDEAGIAQLDDTGDIASWTTEIINGWLIGNNAAGNPALIISRNTDGTISLYNPDGSLCFVRAEE